MTEIRTAGEWIALDLRMWCYSTRHHLASPCFLSGRVGAKQTCTALGVQVTDSDQACTEQHSAHVDGYVSVCLLHVCAGESTSCLCRYRFRP